MLERMEGFLVGIMVTASLTVSVTLTLEVSIMKAIIALICVVAGTALLGRSGMTCFQNYEGTDRLI
jgi:hypothetical protein